MSRQRLSVDKIHVKDEYFDLVPRPTNVERYALKQSIQQDGQLQPIIVNPEGIILDGHTRWEVCLELDLDPKFEVKRFADEEQERNYVVMSNIARRHLSKFQKIELAWDIYQREKERARLRVIAQGGSAERRAQAPESEGMSSEIFGKMLGTGHTTIGMVEYLKNNAPQEMLQKLRDDQISISRAYDIIKGLKLLPRRYARKPSTAPTECPQCHFDVVTKEERKCHVHRWYCCTGCKWGI